VTLDGLYRVVVTPDAPPLIVFSEITFRTTIHNHKTKWATKKSTKTLGKADIVTPKNKNPQRGIFNQCRVCLPKEPNAKVNTIATMNNPRLKYASFSYGFMMFSLNFNKKKEQQCPAGMCSHVG